jgi:hypothetical protein
MRREVDVRFDRACVRLDLAQMGVRIVRKLQEEVGHIFVAKSLHDRLKFFVMDRSVFLRLSRRKRRSLNALDGRKRRFLRRKGGIPFERDDNVLVADEALAGEAVAWWHVVDFGIHNLLAREFAKLPQQLLFFLGQRNAMLEFWAIHA